MQKLVLLSLYGYFGKIESGIEKTQNCSYTFFVVNWQCCVRVSASNFQVVTRKSGGVRAFVSIVRFLAGPARTYRSKRAPPDPTSFEPTSARLVLSYVDTTGAQTA